MSKSDNKKWLIGAGILTGTYAVLDIIGKKNKAKNAMGIDDGNPYLDSSSTINQSADEIEDPAGSDAILEPELVIPDNFYVAHGKRVIDKALSFAGLVVLAPVYGAVSLAIIIDDPGPVLFTQKRVGKDKHFFKLHKFRSMKMSTPHDVPTHQLSNPDKYITRVGKILRKTSLDELPQIWDIFIGNMSIIGPRPALWNQEDLVAERDKYKANDLIPGLTGWAQINGRDELEIPVKAQLDGNYTTQLYESGTKALFLDTQCFFGTLLSVVKKDGIVEGGTGEIEKSAKLVENEQIKVSIITPAYNAREFINETIDSVLQQSYRNWEMLIVDDCSTDDTVAVVQKYVENDSRIILIHHERNKGVAVARNTALDVATGSYMAFLDSDDQWAPQKLEQQLNFMENNHYVLTYTAYQKFDTVTGKKQKVIHIPNKMTVEDIYKNTVIACLTVMINRDVVGKFHMPLINHTEDQITWQEILKRGRGNSNLTGNDVAYGLDECLALYRTGNISLTGNQKKAAREQWATYREFYGFSVLRSTFYFMCYSQNAVKKHFF